MENENIRILIVDDEVLIAETLKDYLQKLGFKQIKMTHSKKETFELLSFWKPHVALLDIRMEELYDGLEIGEQFKSDYKIPFMYVTAHSDMEMTQRILKSKPDGYITKPIRINELMINLGMVIQRFQEVQNEILIEFKNGYDTERIHLSELLYIKAEGNYVEIFLVNRKVVVRNTLEAILQEINNELIVRIHRSFAVNVQKVKKRSTIEIDLGEIQLPISRSYSQVLK
ncbi:MAG: LytR/AlgR family response regulator transcription factor [Fluviicola sp.]|jgi:DNA-binding LytR/AlgR family response regulator